MDEKKVLQLIAQGLGGNFVRSEENAFSRTFVFYSFISVREEANLNKKADEESVKLDGDNYR